MIYIFSTLSFTNNSLMPSKDSPTLVKVSRRLSKDSRRLVKYSRRLVEVSWRLVKDTVTLVKDSWRLAEDFRRLSKDSPTLPKDSRRLVKDSRTLSKDSWRLVKDSRRLSEDSWRLVREYLFNKRCQFCFTDYPFFFKHLFLSIKCYTCLYYAGILIVLTMNHIKFMLIFNSIQYSNTVFRFICINLFKPHLICL